MAKKKFNQVLLNEELKKFRLLTEYDFYTGGIDEDDDEGDVDLDTLEPVDAATDDIASELGVDPPQDGAEPGSDTPPQGDENGESGDIPDSSTTPPPTEEPAPAPAPVEEEGVEIDVTDLVKTGEETKKVAAMSGHKTDVLLAKFEELQQRVSNMTSLTDKIDALEKEIIKRVPTPVEKLEMRSFDSYPYSVKLDDYWSDKEDAYDVMNKKEEEYTLTKDDVDASYSENSIKKSFTDFDEQL